MPPPPPNEIVYGRMTQGIKVDSICDPVWVTGKFRAETKTSRMGAAAYTLSGEKLEPYTHGCRNSATPKMPVCSKEAVNCRELC